MKFRRTYLIFCLLFFSSYVGFSQERVYPTYNHLTKSSLSPFPSDYFTIKDSNFNYCKGKRLNFTEEDLPKNHLATYSLDASSLNKSDGFSMVGDIIVNFSGEIDENSLPKTSFGEEDSSIYFVNIDKESKDYGEYIPFKVLVDYIGPKSFPPSYNIRIKPIFPLMPCTTYGIIITNRVKDIYGNNVVKDKRFEEVIENNNFSYINDVIEFATTKLNLKLSDITLAFSFSTRSIQSVTNDMIYINKLLNKEVEKNPPSFNISAIKKTSLQGDIKVNLIKGAYKSPSFKGENGIFNYDENGLPYYNNKENIEFLLMIPDLKKGKQAPLIIYQHGLGNSKEEFLSTIGPKMASLGFAIIGIDLYGHGARSNGAPPVYGYMNNFFDFNNIEATRDNFRQSMADLFYLAALIKKNFKNLDLFPRETLGDGVPDLILDNLYFTGISLGSIIGASFVGIDNKIKSAVLYVGGGGIPYIVLDKGFSEYNVVKFQLGTLFVVSASPKSSTEDLLHTFSLAQLVLDPADPLNYSNYLIKNPLPNNFPKNILMIEAIGDSVVPNSCTEDLARAIGVDLVAPYVNFIDGISTVSSPVSNNITTTNNIKITGGLFQYPHSDHIRVCINPKSHNQVGFFFLSYFNNGEAIIINPFKKFN